MNNPALKHKIILDRPHRSNSPSVPSQLLQILFVFDHDTTSVTAISTANNWNDFVKHRYASTVINK